MSDTPDVERDQQKLDDIQERIDEVRESVNEGTELDDDPRFIDSGEKSDVVDDTIAPPG